MTVLHHLRRHDGPHFEPHPLQTFIALLAGVLVTLFFFLLLVPTAR